MDIEILGYIATLFSATQLVPEVMKALKTHHLRDISWAMLAIMLISSVLWTGYGVLKGSMPLLLSAGINGIMQAVLIFLKWNYGRRGHHILRNNGIKPLPQEQEAVVIK